MVFCCLNFGHQSRFHLTEDILPQHELQAPADVLKMAGVKLLGQKGEYMAMLRCLFSVALYHQSTLSSRFYSQQGGRTLKRRDLEVQHSHLFIFKCFVQLQSLQYQLSNRSSSVWWVMLPSLHDLRLGVSYPRRVVDDVDAARSAFLSVARQCRAAAPAECASKIHGAYVSAWMG